MYCPKCYRQIPDNSKFCPSCGADVSVPVCIGCGGILSPGDKHCSKCGLAVSAYKEPPKRPVDWVFAEDAYDQEEKPHAAPGSWQDFCNDMSDLARQTKDNWKGYAEKAKQSYQQFQQDNAYEENAPSAEYESIPNTCPSCSSTNISYQTVSESKGIGCFSWLVILIIAFFVNPIWCAVVLLFFMLARKSTKTVTYAVCQHCGNRWKYNHF